ncbi:hypothetical protein [Enterobacter cloacae]|uniref:hypothetical protein n=1 Tax=Enterobacter cloacae complex TaxID=354276 RepID=UPI0027912F12|nr:hypothetical protein [Enterobacter cloacae]MDQ1757936.1 hypothetical protein [Enterobacter cloacae]
MVASTVSDLPLSGRGDLRTLTVRNIPSAVDEAITEQARKAGRSKSDFLQEFLVATFGDLIGNFIRTSELVALMDREMARMMDAELRESPYDAGLTLDGHREFCRILGILSEADLQRIMMAGVPHLSVRVRQLEGLTRLSQGASLYAALLAEAATRDEKTLLTLYRSQFHMMSEEGFLEEAEEFRAAMRLPPLEREDF